MTSSTVDAQQVRDDLRAFITENFLYVRPDVQLDDDADLVGLRVLDSLAFVELVEEVQQRYGVRVEDTEITLAHFGSVRSMAAFVESKRRGS